MGWMLGVVRGWGRAVGVMVMVMTMVMMMTFPMVLWNLLMKTNERSSTSSTSKHSCKQLSLIWSTAAAAADYRTALTIT